MRCWLCVVLGNTGGHAFVVSSALRTLKGTQASSHYAQRRVPTKGKNGGSMNGCIFNLKYSRKYVTHNGYYRPCAGIIYLCLHNTIYLSIIIILQHCSVGLTRMDVLLSREEPPY